MWDNIVVILLEKYPQFIIYFENIKDFRIATCGRWCIYRLYKFLIDGDDNAAFIRHMKEQKNGTSLTYDEIICIAAPV